MNRWSAAAVLLAVPGVALLAPPPDGPLAPLLQLVHLAAGAAAAWLLLLTALTCGSRVPGSLGRTAGWAARWVAPTAVRSVVAVALGVTLTAAPATALAEDRTPTVAGSIADSLDWPGLAPVTVAPVTAAAPTAPHPATSTPSVPPPAPAPDVVVVSAGDSLWALAHDRLGEDASDTVVARAWPQWWQANRDVIGDDPDLLHPGDRLTAPAPAPLPTETSR